MKNPHAVALGSRGGKATAKKPLTLKQLAARRANAAKATAARKKKVENNT